MTPDKLIGARGKLELDAHEMAQAMGVSYHTYRQWESGRRAMQPVAARCVELLLLHPRTARRLAKR